MEAPINFSVFLEDPNSELAIQECNRVADLFMRFGALTLRDPRVTFDDNQIFLDIVEAYFNQPEELKMKDVYPQYSYQVGTTPEGVEFPRCAKDPECKKLIDSMSVEDRAHYPDSADVKWRYFHRLGEQPKVTEFPLLNAPVVIPEAFKSNWQEKMDNWGKKLLGAGVTLAEMAAVGFKLPRDTFKKLIQSGPHLLAPTASDLEKYGSLHQILAGFHKDLNFVTLHGKSRFPGLFIWLRDGKKIPVSIPDGCLLAQAGMQFEYLTAGSVIAGYHEVVVTEKTIEALTKARQEKRCLWRISSTVFIHVASDKTLEPLLETDQKDKFPSIKAGHQVERELKAISLMSHE